MYTLAECAIIACYLISLAVMLDSKQM